jgi:hypothetical protein
MWRTAGRRIALAASAIGLLLAPACQNDEKVIKYHPFLANLPDAKTQTKPVGDRFGGKFADPTAVPDNKIVIEKPDGQKILIARSVRQMMTHVEQTLDDGDEVLLYEQVISQETKEQYRAKGKDPLQIIDYLKEHRKQIAVLFSRMPFAEQSPNVILEQPGDKVFLIRLTGLAAKDTEFTRLWAKMEKGNWKFLWVD